MSLAESQHSRNQNVMREDFSEFWNLMQRTREQEIGVNEIKIIVFNVRITRQDANMRNCKVERREKKKKQTENKRPLRQWVCHIKLYKFKPRNQNSAPNVKLIILPEVVRLKVEMRRL